MSELELYKKMYATLVGRTDAVISEMVDMALHEKFDRTALLLLADKLRRALSEAEDMYLDAGE